MSNKKAFHEDDSRIHPVFHTDPVSGCQVEGSSLYKRYSTQWLLTSE